MSNELTVKYRPKTFKEMYGQSSIKSNLLDLCKKRRLPHCILLSGPPGTGKTTVARILALKMRCTNKADFMEMNAASSRGIDDMRDKIERRINLSPVTRDGTRFWVLDEAHKLTNDAQNSLLKNLEEPPDHAYFVLCTTTPLKLIKTIRDRATIFTFELLSYEEIRQLIEDTAKKEQVELSEEVIEKIISVADGTPRKALKMLDKILTLEDEDERLEAIQATDVERQAIELVRLLSFDKVPWKQIASLIKELDEREETFRHLVLGYATKVLLGGGKFAPRAYLIIQCMRDPWYECGKAGLVSACYEVMIQSNRSR